jgi:hypothetical protein
MRNIFRIVVVDFGPVVVVVVVAAAATVFPVAKVHPVIREVVRKDLLLDHLLHRHPVVDRLQTYD